MELDMKKWQLFLLSLAVIALVSCASIPRQKLNQLDSLNHIMVIATNDADPGRLTEVWADSYSLNVETRLITFSCPGYESSDRYGHRFDDEPPQSIRGKGKIADTISKVGLSSHY
jgi:hypothetical protein